MWKDILNNERVLFNPVNKLCIIYQGHKWQYKVGVPTATLFKRKQNTSSTEFLRFTRWKPNETSSELAEHFDKACRRKAHSKLAEQLESYLSTLELIVPVRSG